MKTLVGTLVLLGTLLTTATAVAQAPQSPRGGPASSEPRGDAGETRATINQSGATLAAERTASVAPAPASAQPGCEAGTIYVDTGGSDASGQAPASTNHVGGGGGTGAPASGRRYEELGTRASVSQSGGTLAMERAANPAAAPAGDAATANINFMPPGWPYDDARTAPSPTDTGGNARSAPTNGLGQTGGGRLSNRDHIDQDATGERGGRARASGPAPATEPAATRGTGGGRYTFMPTQIINNSQQDPAVADSRIPVSADVPTLRSTAGSPGSQPCPPSSTGPR